MKAIKYKNFVYQPNSGSSQIGIPGPALIKKKKISNLDPRKKTLVMMVSRSGTIGGVEEHVSHLSQYLCAQGCEVIWIILSSVGLSNKYKSIPGVQLIALNDSHDQSFSSFLLLRRLFHLVWKYRPSVVHLHGIRPMVLFSLFPFPRGAHRISTVHGSYLLMTMTEDGKVVVWKKLLSAVFHLFSCWRSHQVIAVSKSLIRELQQIAKPFTLKNIKVISNGIECNNHKTKEKIPTKIRETFVHGEIQVVFIGRLDPKKGIDILIRAAASIDTVLPIRYHFIGDGYMRSQYELDAQILNLEQRTHFWGDVERAGEIVSSFDILVLPSYSEGMPLTVLEAMAAGVPVIATKVGGIPEVVIDGETGCLFEPGDVCGLARYIKLLAEQKELRLKFGQSGRIRVRSLFNRMHQLPKINSCYHLKKEPHWSI